MADIEKTALIILGDGEQKNSFLKLADDLQISNRVFFIGTISQDDLINFTSVGDVGLSIIENISISYFHALPNKMFEYIMAGLPVLASDLPQMKKIIDKYKVGECVNLSKEEELLLTLNNWVRNPNLLQAYKDNCVKAASELNWQEEYNSVRKILLGLN